MPGTPLHALVKDRANYWPPRTFQLRGQRYKRDSSIPIADQFLLPDGKFRGRGPSTHSQRSPEMAFLEMRGYMSLRAL